MTRTRRTDRERPAPGRNQRPEPESRSRKAYAAPELTEYGTVAKLTQTGGATTIDFVGMMGMKL